MIHFFKKSVSHIALPEKFTYPFHYTPHPLCVLAAEVYFKPEGMAGRIDAWKDVRGIDCTRDRKKDKKREGKRNGRKYR